MTAPQDCRHPIGALRLASASVKGSTVTVKLECGECVLPITKAFLTSTPDQTPRPVANMVFASEMGKL
jgi:hypothetical protein